MYYIPETGCYITIWNALGWIRDNAASKQPAGEQGLNSQHGRRIFFAPEGSNLFYGPPIVLPYGYRGGKASRT
jgi:hypothetical protein